MAQDDAELVRCILGGDRSAFEVLDGRYRRVALSIAFRLVGDSAEAEDVVQEAMLRAYTRLEQLSDPARLGPWLATIVRNVGLDHLRQRMRRREQLTDWHQPLAASLTQSMTYDGTDRIGDIREPAFEEALGALSRPLAQVIRLRIHDGLRPSEISERLGLPLCTVKRRLHDARKHIRRSTMTTFDEQAAWDIVHAAAREIDNLPHDVKDGIVGVVVGGDLPRQDFIPNNSSLLVFPLITNCTTLFIYDSPAYRAIVDIFDRLCAPYFDCSEAPMVWQNQAFDEVNLPVSAESFDPPTTPQCQWHSMYLFDLIEHHQVVYGEDFVKRLYRPQPKDLTVRMAAEVLRAVRSQKTTHPAGFETVAHWQALKMVAVLQLHFSDVSPTIAWQQVLENYSRHVPEFPSKRFGEQQWRQAMRVRYPADRRTFSHVHAGKCRSFVEDACELLVDHRGSLAWQGQRKSDNC